MTRFRFLTLIFLLPAFCLGADKDLRPALDTLINRFKNSMDIREYERAGKILDTIRTKYEEDASGTEKFWILNCQGWYLGRTKQFKEQYEICRNALLHAEKIKRTDLIYESQMGLGGFYEQFGDLQNAIPHYLQALDVIYELKDESQKANLYNKLGLVYYSDEDYESAEKYFFGAFCIFYKHHRENGNNAYWVQNTIANVGLCHYRRGNYRKALACQRFALGFTELVIPNNMRALSVLRASIGFTFDNLKQYDQAEKYMLEGLKGTLDPVYEELPHGTHTLIMLAGLYTKTGRTKLAQNCLNKAQEIIQKNHLSGFESPYYIALANLEKASGNLDAAFKHLTRYLKLHDSLEMLSKQEAYSNLILAHNLQRSKESIQFLEKENDYYLLWERIYMAAGVLFLIGIAAIVFALRNSKRHNKHLTELNTQISAQKTELEQLNQQLSIVDRNRQHLIQSVAHDLRTPIGNIMSLSGLLEDFNLPAEEQKDYQRFLGLVRSSSQFALQIMDDILDQSLLEKGRFQLNRTTVDLCDLVQESIDLMEFKSDPKQIKVKKHCLVNLVIQGDAERLKRVFANIISNAIKFSPRNQEILVESSLEGEFARISIRDHGIGIPEDMIHQIFERNTNAAREGLEKERTIGIGLSISRSIVEEHGGHIDVESQPGSGSTFYIYLPLNPTSSVAAGL